MVVISKDESIVDIHGIDPGRIGSIQKVTEELWYNMQEAIVIKTKSIYGHGFTILSCRDANLNGTSYVCDSDKVYVRVWNNVAIVEQ